MIQQLSQLIQLLARHHLVTSTAISQLEQTAIRTPTFRVSPEYPLLGGSQHWSSKWSPETTFPHGQHSCHFRRNAYLLLLEVESVGTWFQVLQESHSIQTWVPNPQFSRHPGRPKLPTKHPLTCLLPEFQVSWRRVTTRERLG